MSCSNSSDDLAVNLREDGEKFGFDGFPLACSVDLIRLQRLFPLFIGGVGSVILTIVLLSSRLVSGPYINWLGGNGSELERLMFASGLAGSVILTYVISSFSICGKLELCPDLVSALIRITVKKLVLPIITLSPFFIVSSLIWTDYTLFIFVCFLAAIFTSLIITAVETSLLLVRRNSPVNLVVIGSDECRAAVENFILEHSASAPKTKLFKIKLTPASSYFVSATNQSYDCDHKGSVPDIVVLEDNHQLVAKEGWLVLQARESGALVCSHSVLRTHFQQRIVPEKQLINCMVGDYHTRRWWQMVGGVVIDTLERLFACLLLLSLLPLALVVALAIRLESKGPALYWQRRVGKGGKTFWMVKFRSMRIDAEASGPKWANNSDDRTTKVGKFIRKTRLDEIPQLYNVVRGEMKFVGPRPERPEINQELVKQIPFFYLRSLVKPGITGLAQVKAGYAASVEESKLKLQYDLYFIRNRSLAFSLEILLLTVATVLLRREFILNVPDNIQNNQDQSLSTDIDKKLAA